MLQTDLVDLNTMHLLTYDNVADEYENRVGAYYQVTKQTLRVMAKYLPLKSEVLDVGCAVGYTIQIINNMGYRVDGIDISPKMIKFAQKRNPTSNIILGDFLAYQFGKKYDGIVAFAFIHLFPKNIALQAIEKMKQLLKTNGVMFITTTKSNISSEGFETKKDYKQKPERYRKRWTVEEFEEAIDKAGLEVIEKLLPTDAFGKVWMDYLVKSK
jgi:2-polyprenyl-3-methyl-5-hydroxy-6-metoxy-1,4-benzoquinol methylase